MRLSLENHEEEFSQPSGSDVVRAALHHFMKLGLKTQLGLIEEYRRRGRK